MELIQETDVPHWLQPPVPEHVTPTEYTEWHWEETLRRLSAGETLKSICSTSNMPDYGRYQRWIHDKKHPERKERYREAQMLATESHADDYQEDMANQYDDDGNPKDLEWTKEKNRMRQFLMKTWNRDRYGEKKETAQVEINMGSLALDALRKRTVDVTPVSQLENTTGHVLEHEDGA